MTDGKLDKLKAELDEWRGRLEHLRVQANLGKKELRDRLQDLGKRLEPAYDRAHGALNEAVHSGAVEARNIAKSLQAGWEELVRTHRELAAEAESEKRKS